MRQLQNFGENGMKVVCAARSVEQGQAVADAICADGGDAVLYRRTAVM